MTKIPASQFGVLHDLTKLFSGSSASNVAHRHGPEKPFGLIG
jgi:hypothetical protein